MLVVKVSKYSACCEAVSILMFVPLVISAHSFIKRIDADDDGLPCNLLCMLCLSAVAYHRKKFACFYVSVALKFGIGRCFHSR